jgi:hypothetical protein
MYGPTDTHAAKSANLKAYIYITSWGKKIEGPIASIIYIDMHFKFLYRTLFW